MNINDKGLWEAYLEVYSSQEIEEGKQSFPAERVKKQMEKARKGSVYGRETKNEPSPQVSDTEKKETTRFSKMHHASEKAKREKQEADKARRSPTFYKDTHPASAPKMKKVREEVEIGEAIDPKGAKRQDAAKDKKKIDVFAYDRKIGRKNIPPAPKNEEVDLFDYILEHLVAEGYADTNDAALAIMANMSEDWREDIVEAAKDQSNKQIEKGVKTTYKAGNVLDNQHQGRSKGLNKLPAGERSAKTERMRGRLKARRDDLFGERNKREDEARAEMKKRLGL